MNSEGKGNPFYPNSVDAIVDKDEKIYFIEFKNGDVNTKQIHSKAKDSLLIYAMLRNRLIDPKKCVFIVAYNEKKRGAPEKHRSDVIQPSPKRRLIAKRVMKKSGKELIQFGCSPLIMYYGEVHTFDEREFSEYLIVELKK